MKSKSILTILIVVLLAAFLAGCGGGQSAEAPVAEPATQAAPTATPAPPTPTPVPPTATPVPPTATPVPPTPTPEPPTPTLEPENEVLMAAEDYYSGGLKFIDADKLY
jgi:flagellar basal body L-ring protein FlgH